MPTSQSDIQLIRMLADRLERISADSVWAHRASGIRRSLLRILDETQQHPSSDTISNVIAVATYILSQAAKSL